MPSKLFNFISFVHWTKFATIGCIIKNKESFYASSDCLKFGKNWTPSNRFQNEAKTAKAEASGSMKYVCTFCDFVATTIDNFFLHFDSEHKKADDAVEQEAEQEKAENLEQVVFLKFGHFPPLFVYFRLFEQFLQQINVKNVHPVYGAGIQTHDLWNESPPITTTPGLPLFEQEVCTARIWLN